MNRIQFKAAPQSGAPEFKHTDARLEFKADGLADGVLLHIKAYALAFGNIDSWGDIIEPGACDAFLKSAEADRMALCWQHDMRTVIGKITDKGVDDHGMWIEADVLDTSAGRDAAVLLKAGAVKEFSIGYRADQYEWRKVDGYDYDIRILKAITVHECSPVTKAANPEAIVISAKSIEHESPAGGAPKNDNIIPNNNSTMTPEEIKAMRESIEKAAAEKVAAELAEKAKELKAAQEKIGAQEKSIDNLDKSMKDLQAQYEDLKAAGKSAEMATVFGALKAAIEGKREEIKAMLDKHSGSMKIEFEVKDDPVSPLASTQISNIAYGVALERGVHSARILPNVFYEAFAKDVVRAMEFNWLEGSFTDNTGYVDELAAPADSTATAEEKSRKFGKLAAHLRVSSEVADFFEEVYNWARNTAQRKIDAKVDREIFDGLGNDTANPGTGASPKKIYGLKNYATAFSATGAKYANATIADVILDAQIQAQAHGYTLSRAYVSFADYANIRGLKNANGNYLFNEVTGLLGGVSIVPSSYLTSGQMLLVDQSVVRIKERPVWEFEIVRNANLDGWDIYLRKAAQVLVKSNDLYGVIWVASVSTAIAAITEDAATLGGVVTKLNDIKTELATIKTNSGNIKDYSTAIGGINTAITKLSGAVNESNQVETHPNAD